MSLLQSLDLPLNDEKRRDEVVIATKFTFNARAGDPNAGGNGRKNAIRALEGSLKRLQTDYVDLYWLHAWDMLTPAEEVVNTLDQLVRSGKVRYVGFSNVPAWYLGQAHTLATLRGLTPVCSLQMEYSLVERAIEHEFVAAQQLGLGICPWSPLADGFLSGKYERTKDGGTGQGRLEVHKNPIFDRFTPRNWDILDTLSIFANSMWSSRQGLSPPLQKNSNVFPGPPPARPAPQRKGSPSQPPDALLPHHPSSPATSPSHTRPLGI